jgi:uncharacterized protein
MKTTILSLLLVATLMFLMSAIGADVTPQNEVRYIDVAGSARMLIDPNEVYFNIELREYLKGKEKVSLDTLEQQLNAALKAANIPLENLTVVRFNAAQYYKNLKSHEFLGTKSLKLKVTEASQLNPFFAALENSEVRNVYYERSSHSELLKLKDDNKVVAIKAAHTKAKAMVEAVGAKLGLPIYIIESPAVKSSYNEVASVEVITVVGSKYGKSLSEEVVVFENNDITFEKIQLYSEVSVRFEILP